jgi:hypothetical protein
MANPDPQAAAAIAAYNNANPSGAPASFVPTAAPVGNATGGTGTPSPYVPTSDPINRSIDPSTNDPATNYLNNFQPPETRAQITERLRQAAQGSIDGINAEADQAIADAKKSGTDRLNVDNATSVLSGLMGSTEAGRTHNEVVAANDKALQAVYAKKAADLSTVYGNINKAAQDEARQQVQDANKSAQDIVARRAQVQQDAISNLKLMASGGLVDFNALKDNPANQAVYQHALQAVGGSEDALRGLFAVNRPQDQIVGTPTRVGDHYVQAYKNPITGKVSMDTIQVPGGLPPEYKSFQKVGNSIVAIPDGWNGDISQLKTITGPAGTGTGGGTGSGGVSAQLEQAISSGLIDPNKVNSRTLGIYNDLAKAQIDTAGAHASISGNTKAYEDATRYATTATRVIGVLDKNMPLLATLADKVNQTGVPGLDQYITGIKSYTGNNQDVVKYVSTLKTLRSEYAQMLSRGAAVTESDKAEAAQAIPGGLSGANYLSLQKQLKLEGQNIISTANDTKNSLFKSTQQNNSPSDPLGLGI